MADPTARRCAVLAASRHGATDEIADRIADTIGATAGSGWTVERVPFDVPSSYLTADAVVLGSAIYVGRWLRPARRALRSLQGTDQDLWLFSSGPVSESPDDNRRLIAADGSVSTGRALGHRVFSGRLATVGLTRPERFALRLVRARFGDYRDWNDIDSWARAIAEHCRSRAASDAAPAPARSTAASTSKEGTS